MCTIGPKLRVQVGLNMFALCGEGGVGEPRAVVKSTFVESKTSPSPKRFESESSPSPKRFESESKEVRVRVKSESKEVRVQVQVQVQMRRSKQRKKKILTH